MTERCFKTNKKGISREVEPHLANEIATSSVLYPRILIKTIKWGYKYLEEEHITTWDSSSISLNATIIHHQKNLYTHRQDHWLIHPARGALKACFPPKVPSNTKDTNKPLLIKYDLCKSYISLYQFHRALGTAIRESRHSLINVAVPWNHLQFPEYPIKRDIARVGESVYEEDKTTETPGYFYLKKSQLSRNILLIPSRYKPSLWNNPF